MPSSQLIFELDRFYYFDPAYILPMTLTIYKVHRVERDEKRIIIKIQGMIF